MVQSILPRGNATRLARMLNEHPVVVLEGARAVGKTTLVRSLIDQGLLSGRYVGLDQEAEIAIQDPSGWLATLPFGSVIDEAQLVPGLLPAIKAVIDQDPRPGRFLLTGSSRLRRDELGGSDPLVGRAGRIGLFPLTSSELASRPRSIATELATGDPTTWPVASVSRANVLKWVSQGGMPGAIGLSQPARFERFDTYPDRTLAPAVIGSRRHGQILRVARYVMAASPVPENIAELSRHLEVSRDTIIDYLDILEQAFLIWRLPGFSPDRAAGELRRARLVSFDSGLGSLIASIADPDPDPAGLGGQLETFVLNELRAQASWHGDTQRISLHHWRFKDRAQVDCVLVSPNGDLVAIEIKMSERAEPAHTKWLDSFTNRYAGQGRKIRTYVFYTGDRVIGLRNHWFIPIAALCG